jgi:SH3-like domain-containing protein
LANRYLVAAYVIPIPRKIGAAGAQLLLTPSDTAEVVTTLEPGARFEALDYAGDWCWGCCGPEGPSGYLPIAQLA